MSSTLSVQEKFKLGLCEHPPCLEVRRFGFNVKGAGIPRFCQQHAAQGMTPCTSVYRSPLCHHRGCNISASYHYPGQFRGIYCSGHKLDGMTYVKGIRDCSQEGCTSAGEYALDNGYRVCGRHMDMFMDAPDQLRPKQASPSSSTRGRGRLPAIYEQAVKSPKHVHRDVEDEQLRRTTRPYKRVRWHEDTAMSVSPPAATAAAAAFPPTVAPLSLEVSYPETLVPEHQVFQLVKLRQQQWRIHQQQQQMLAHLSAMSPVPMHHYAAAATTTVPFFQ